MNIIYPTMFSMLFVPVKRKAVAAIVCPNKGYLPT